MSCLLRKHTDYQNKSTRWFKYDRDKLWLVYTQSVPVIFEPPCKFHPGTRHEDPEEEQRYSSTLSLTSALDGGGWLKPRPSCFTPGKETRYPLYRRMAGPEKCRPHRDSILGPPRPYLVATTTELSRSALCILVTGLNVIRVVTQRSHPHWTLTQVG